ncbi:MAG TPA: DNA internalization-related competence protein ComEC/Rec2 [Woeseiaceae bacterium]|nr:DNA internalization-related competence protein ComEC/Rec2 [Woeseiaceae bacterium]
MIVRAFLCFLIGVFAPQLISFSRLAGLVAELCCAWVSPYMISAIVAAVVVLLWCMPEKWRRDLCCAAIGASLFLLNAELVIAERLDPELSGDSILTQIHIIDFPRTDGATTSFVARVSADARFPSRIRLSWFEAPVSLHLGDTWQVELRLRRPRGASNPGGMDLEAWLMRDRTGATGYVVDGKFSRLIDSGDLQGILRIRQNFVERVSKLLPGREAAGVLVALVVGARHLISSDAWQRYANTGTSHLMAISGLHIGLAATVSYFLASLVLGLTGGQSNQHDKALLVAMLIAVLYAGISGFAVPARRATLMLALLITVLLKRRQPGSFTVLVSAAALLAILDPLSTMAPGYKLSFGAVGILLWHAKSRYPGRSGFLGQHTGALRRLVAIQFALLAGLVPITVLIFDRIAVLAPLVNLLAVPLFSVVTVPAALLGLLLDGPFRVPGDYLLHLSAMSIDCLERLLAVTASDSARPVAEPVGIAWLFLFLPVLWLLLPAAWPGRYVAWAGFMALIAYRPDGPAVSCLSVTMLDVGQGLAVVARTQDHNLLYDSGPAYRSGGSAGERVILPYLESQGIRQLDKAVISHSDLDHAGGLDDLLDEVAIGEIQSGDELPWINVPVSRCEAGTSWTWNQVRFSILYPPSGSRLTGNDASCVLLLEAGARKLLLTGDIEEKIETRLVQSRVLPTVDVATVPHHGSRTSSIAPFVLSLESRLALVSAAYANQWGFPKEDVVARWEGAGAELFNTARSGAITVHLCADQTDVRIIEYRNSRRRIWHEE